MEANARYFRGVEIAVLEKPETEPSVELALPPELPAPALGLPPVAVMDGLALTPPVEEPPLRLPMPRGVPLPPESLLVPS